YTDPDGNFIASQFFLNLLQVTGGVIEVAGGVLAEGVSAGVSTFAVLDGIYNIADGVTGMLTACVDKNYDGLIAETTKAIASTAGATPEEQELAGAVASMADCLVDMKVTSGIKFAKGARNASRIANGIDRANDIIGKVQTANTGLGTSGALDSYVEDKTGKNILQNIGDMNATPEEINKMMERYYEHH
ncbi:MAG: hypothetical protein HUK25_09765, partial [Treponema sp.]|nr:hypothetical protein [Treponema sp.]